MTRRHLPSPKTWTLRAQLLAGILVLFTVVMLGTGVLTVFATRNYLAQGLETDLNLAADRGGVTAHIEPDARFDDDGATRFPGSGTVVLRLALNDGQVVSDDRGDPINQVVDRSNTPTTLSRASAPRKPGHSASERSSAARKRAAASSGSARSSTPCSA